MNKTIFIILLLFFASTELHASDAIHGNEYWGSETKKVELPLRTANITQNIPDFIRKEYKNLSIRVFQIDLDSDKKPDYIVHQNEAFKTCFIKSDNSKKYCEKLGYGGGFHYYWFIQLDDSPMLEFFSMVGDADYSEYELYRFDYKTWEKQKIFQITPFIVARKSDKKHQGIYWGYPWNIKGINIKIVNGVRKFRASLNFNKFDNIPIETGLYPMMFFDGLPTQEESRGYFEFLENENKCYSLKELIKDYFKITQTQNKK